MKAVALSLVILTLCVCAAGLVACDDTELRANDDFVIGTTADIRSADRSDYDFDQLSAGLTQQALISRGDDGEYHPLLADYSDDSASVWTFTVRDGMCWDDGVPVTANDILFTLRYNDEHESGHWLSSVTDTSGGVTQSTLTAAEVSEDGRSIDLVYRTPDVRALASLTSVRIMPEHIYKNKTIETASAEENRVGCGVYSFESFSKDSGTIVFVLNPYYPADSVLAAKRVVVRLFSNDTTMQMAMLNGELDTIWKYSGGVEAEFASALVRAGVADVIPVTADNLPAVLAFNTSCAPFDSLLLRQAVVYALDPVKFAELFASEYAETPRAGFVPPSTLGYTPNTAPLSRDLEKARDCLARGLAELGDSSLSFSLTVNADNTLHLRYAELVQTQFAEIGIKVTLDEKSKSDFQHSTTNTGTPTHQACIIGYTSNGMKMMGGLGTIYMDGDHPVQGVSQVFDEEFDDILDALSSASDLASYEAAAERCIEWYARYLPAVALIWDARLQVLSARWTGAWTDADFGLINMRTWLSLERTD